ncbi:GNAT family N-acetyltransferase [Vibrio mexicanus]|uniref:GNAT family N-acetyltransferase n=1 Tax=Vibrio mexicanus TaxID=1004326 RepID=UPI00063CB6C7|nr:GNAT family N-acetyltransferase [Vibrio mexicanus]
MDNIVISELRDSDRRDVFDLLQDAQTMRFLGPRRALTESESEKWFIKEQQAESRFAFRFIETNEIVGFCGITLIDGELDFGYFIRRKFWGQGFATLMCEITIHKLSEAFDLSQVKVFIANDNVGSQQVANKLGWPRKCEAESEFESGHHYQIRI